LREVAVEPGKGVSPQTRLGPNLLLRELARQVRHGTPRLPEVNTSGVVTELSNWID